VSSIRNEMIRARFGLASDKVKTKLTSFHVDIPRLGTKVQPAKIQYNHDIDDRLLNFKVAYKTPKHPPALYHSID